MPTKIIFFDEADGTPFVPLAIGIDARQLLTGNNLQALPVPSKAVLPGIAPTERLPR